LPLAIGKFGDYFLAFFEFVNSFSYKKQSNCFFFNVYFGGTIAKEDAQSQNLLENDSLRAPLNSGEWDSDWDSDFSLHVQPLSDLSESSSDEELWKNRAQRGTNNPNTEERTRKRSDKTTTVIARRKESKPGGTDRGKGPENKRTAENGPRRSTATEDHAKDRKANRPIVKPIPKIGSGMKFYVA